MEFKLCSRDVRDSIIVDSVFYEDKKIETLDVFKRLMDFKSQSGVDGKLSNYYVLPSYFLITLYINVNENKNLIKEIFGRKINLIRLEMHDPKLNEVMTFSCGHIEEEINEKGKLVFEFSQLR